MAHAPLSFEPEVIHILSLENERLKKELDEWRVAAGWTADGFGPQTPNEVAVFQREAERVNGQVTALEISKLRLQLAACAESREQIIVALEGVKATLEQVQTSWQLNRGLLELAKEELATLRKDLDFETDSLTAMRKNGRTVCEQRDQIRTELESAKATAKEALQNLDESEEEVTQLRVRVAELEQEAQVADDLLEQREDAYKLLWESHEREQQTHAVYRESAEDCMRALQTEYDLVQPMLKACSNCFDQCQGLVRYSTEESDNYWELAELLMDLTSERLGITMQRAPGDGGRIENDFVARQEHDADRPESSGSIPTDGSAPDPTRQSGHQEPRG